jgi:hypothetical protein
VVARPRSAVAQTEIQPPATDGPAGPQTPPAAEPPAPTRATFVSTTGEAWDVLLDNVPTCSTPCTLPLHPLQFVTLSSQERSPVLLDVGRLPAGDLVVSGTPLASGTYAGGLVATTLGGMALAVGITFTAVGLAKGRDGMTLAGLITGGAGALALPGGIYLMLRALPGFTINGAAPYTAAVAARF